MNIIKIILFIQIVFLISCNPNKKPSPTNLNYYEIEGIETAFPLPVDYRPVTVKEFEAYSKEETAPIQDFLSFEKNQNITYFKHSEYPEKQVAIFTSKKIIPVERFFSNSFVNVVETQIYKKYGLYLYYEIIQNKFLKVGNRKAFKLKIRSKKNQTDTIYNTYYLISTKTESVIINEMSISDEDIQDVIATFMIKSK